MLKLEHIKWSNKSSHLDQLRNFLLDLSSNINADFNGDNGEEYLEEVAKENGYDNNFDYYFDYYVKFYNVNPTFNLNYYSFYSKLINSILEEMTRGCWKRSWDFMLNDNSFTLAIWIEWD